MLRFFANIFIYSLHSLSEMLEYIFRGLGSSAKDSDSDQDKTWRQKTLGVLLWVPRKLVWAIVEIVSFPFSFASFSDERRRYLLGGAPALLVIFATLGVIGFASTDSESIYRRYRLSMEQAMESGDFELASVLGSRIMENGLQDNSEMKFAIARALIGSKDMLRAQSVLTELAPDQSRGYGPAHAFRALLLANSAKSADETDLLNQLKWHLDNSRSEKNEELYRLRSSYYLKIGQSQLAIEQLELANGLNPRSAIPLSDIYLKQGSFESQKRVLQEAVVRIQRQLNDVPFDKDLRLTMALAYVRLKDFDRAEAVLRKGLELITTPEMTRAVADFYVMRHDEIYRDARDDMARRLGFLEQAIGIDRNHEGVYLRLSQLYTDSKEASESKKVRLLLESMIADGKSPSLAHFALGTVSIMDNDQKRALWHLGQAHKLDKQIPMVCNNLAWMLAHTENPDLDKAFELSKVAVESMPGEPEFKDTLGTILIKQGKLQDAVTVYEKLLSEMPDRKRVHAKLAEIYKELGQPSLSQMHVERSRP